MRSKAFNNMFKRISPKNKCPRPAVQNVVKSKTDAQVPVQIKDRVRLDLLHQLHIGK